jgi:hypothetical protein
MKVEEEYPFFLYLHPSSFILYFRGTIQRYIATPR